MLPSCQLDNDKQTVKELKKKSSFQVYAFENAIFNVNHFIQDSIW